MVAPQRRTLRTDLGSRSHMAAMAHLSEAFQRPIHKRRWYLLAGMTILVAAWSGYVGWQHRATTNVAAAPVAAPQPAIPVTTATAERRDVPIYLAVSVRCRLSTRSRSRRGSMANC